MTQQEIFQLKNQGYTVLKNQTSKEWVKKLSVALDKVFTKYPDGVALHALLESNTFIEYVDYLLKTGLIDNLKTEYFKSNCILNSFSALNNLPNQPNFSANFHRDLRFYSQKLPVMLNCLLMVDDFTKENGGTYILPYSHLFEDKPTEEFFFENAIQIEGKPGDLLIFDSNVWHSSAPNTTNKGRRGIPITISRSFLKPLLDYPRAIGYNRMNEFNNNLQQFLGYHSRVPASLEEWNQPEENRFYKKDQD